MTGRLKRREPGVVSSPVAAEAEPSRQCLGGRGHLAGLVCRRLLGQMVPEARPRPGGGLGRRLPDREVRPAVRAPGNGGHPQQPGQRARGVRRAGEHDGQQRDLGVDPRREGRRHGPGRHRQHGAALLPSGPVQRLPPDADQGHPGHQDEEGPAGREVDLGQRHAARLRGELRLHQRQSRRHAEQLGPGLLVESGQHRARPDLRAVHGPPAPTRRTTSTGPCSSRPCPGRAPPCRTTCATCSGRRR